VVETGQPLTIENVPKFTKDSMPIAFSKIARPNKVDLNQFTAAERESILAGQVKKGMSKNAVLAAIGYPPQHETPSLDGDAWTYWSNLFNRFIVNFKNGKVDNIVD
jgi:outer membrane protein assembly factor BamE (lipoprotein component of BamABCDE complex)